MCERKAASMGCKHILHTSHVEY